MKTLVIEQNTSWEVLIDNPKRPFFLRFMHDPNNGLAISVQSTAQLKHKIPGRVIPIQDATAALYRLGRKVLKMKQT